MLSRTFYSNPFVIHTNPPGKANIRTFFIHLYYTIKKLTLKEFYLSFNKEAQSIFYVRLTGKKQLT
jgi:hypothetical protein